MYTGLVIADDLTGATDTGQQFAVDGYRTVVISWPPSDETESGTGSEMASDVLVVDTDSRTAAETEAYETVAGVVDVCQSEIVYKKIDSTLRGNVVTEIEAVIDHFGPSVAIVAPAFPTNGRVTVGGYHLVNGDPVSSADEYQERESPPSTSHLPTLLSESSYPIKHIPVDVVADGPDRIAADFNAAETNESTTLVVCDAVSEAHLAAITTAAEQIETTVYIGSAGLAEHVELSGDALDRNCVLGIVGSTNERTIDQLATLPSDWVIELDTERALDTPEEAGRVAAQCAATTMQLFDVAVITSVTSPEDADTTYEMGQDRFGLDEASVRTRIETALTTAVEECWVGASPDGLFVTGGTIAKHVLHALDVDTIELTGRDIEDGIPVARFGDSTDLSFLVTKAGGFGDSESVRNCLNTLRRL